MRDLLAGRAAEHHVVGASLAVAREGDVQVHVAGTADRERAVRPDTPFQIASVTKPMVAVVVALLAERGLLDIDDPVMRHVPELRDAGWADGVTIRHLMANTSGIPLAERLEFGFEAEGDDALARFAAAVASLPTVRAPGALWSYSNSGWIVLGRVIETVTGMEWERAMRTELIDPLGLEHTTFRSFDPAVGAHHYLTDAGEPVETEVWYQRALGPAGAAIWSTAEDVARFGVFLLDERFAHLREPHADVWTPHFVDRWCLGMAEFQWDGGTLYGWDGVGGGHRAILRIVPEHDAVFVLLANSSTGRLLYRDLFVELLAPLGIGVPVIDATPVELDDLERYTGTYAWSDRRFVVTVERDALVLNDGVRTRELTPVDERNFLIEGGPAEAPMVAMFNDALYFMVWAYPKER